MNALSQTVGKMSPFGSCAVRAVLAGDDSTGMLHSARREVAAFADRLSGRNRGHVNAVRAALATTALAAYRELATALDARGAL